MGWSSHPPLFENRITPTMTRRIPLRSVEVQHFSSPDAEK
jgi:hypothetical protein